MVKKYFLGGNERYIYKFTLDIGNLSLFDFITEKYLKEWISALIRYRKIKFHSRIVRDTALKFSQKYFLDIGDFDLIKSYRVDDGLFSIVSAFCNGNVPLEAMDRLLKKGGLGEQIILKSELSFRNLETIGYEFVPEYYKERYEQRIKSTNKEVEEEVQYYIKNPKGTYIESLI